MSVQTFKSVCLAAAGALLCVAVASSCRHTAPIPVAPAGRTADVKLSRASSFELFPNVYNGLLLAPIELDGQRGNFLLDTGSSLTLATPAFAARAGLDRRMVHLPIRSNLSASRVPVARAFSARLGPAVFSNPVVVIWNLDHFAAARMPVDGIVGMNLLGKLPFELDAPQRRLTLYPPGGLRRPPGFRIPIDSAPESGLPIIRGSLIGRDSHFLIDSGASFSVLPVALFEGDSTARPGGMRVDINQAHESVPRLTPPLPMILGGRRFDDQSFLLGDAPWPLLGMDFLYRHRIVVDLPAGCVWIRPPRKYFF